MNTLSRCVIGLALLLGTVSSASAWNGAGYNTVRYDNNGRIRNCECPPRRIYVPKPPCVTCRWVPVVTYRRICR
jgi:hypothetical protein